MLGMEDLKIWLVDQGISMLANLQFAIVNQEIGRSHGSPFKSSFGSLSSFEVSHPRFQIMLPNSTRGKTRRGKSVKSLTSFKNNLASKKNKDSFFMTKKIIYIK
jgi:hypothetical protein